MPLDGSTYETEVTKWLIEGRERVAQGWCQFQSRDGNRVCAIGAIIPYPAGVAPQLALDTLIRAAGFVHGKQLSAWNDAPERTQADVLALYGRAIELSVAEAMRP